MVVAIALRKGMLSRQDCGSRGARMLGVSLTLAQRREEEVEYAGVCECGRLDIAH